MEREHDSGAPPPGAQPPLEGQAVVLFLIETGSGALRALEVLPVVDGGIVYAADDPSVRESLTLAELQARVSAGA